MCLCVVFVIYRPDRRSLSMPAQAGNCKSHSCGGYQESGMGRPVVVNLNAPDARDPKHQEKGAPAPDADDSPNALLRRVATDHSLRLLDHSNRLLPQAYDNDEVEAAFQAHYVRTIPRALIVLSACCCRPSAGSFASLSSIYGLVLTTSLLA